MRPWGGRGRRALVAAAAGLAVLLVAVAAWPLLRPAEGGAETPEAAVTELLEGLADQDVARMALAVVPSERADREAIRDHVETLSDSLGREGEAPDEDITEVLEELGEGGGSADERLSLLAAIEMDLDDLGLETESDGSRAVVTITGGGLDLDLDPDELPDRVLDLVPGVDDASYVTPLAEGWFRIGGEETQLSVVAVRDDDRWYVSLAETASAYAGGSGGG